MNSLFWKLVKIGAFLLFVVFLIYPMSSIFVSSFRDAKGAHYTLENYGEFFSQAYYWKSLSNSVVLSLQSVLFSIVIGLPLAYLVGKTNIPGKTVLKTFGTLPVVLPTFVGAYAWVLLLGRSGFISRFLNAIGIPFTSIYGWWGIVLVYAFTYYPFVFLLVLGALQSIDPALEEASLSLGHGRVATTFRVTLPLVIPSILSGGLLVFMQAVENFGVPAIIGEGLPVLATRAYQLFINEMGGNPSMAGALSIILLATTSGVLVLQRLYLAKKSFTMKSTRPMEIISLRPVPRAIATTIAYALCLLPLLPFTVLIVTAFLEYQGPVMHYNLTLENFQSVFARAMRPIKNSYQYTFITTFFVTTIGVLIGYVLTRFKSISSTVLDLVVMLPFVIAGTVYGLALTYSFNTGPLILTGTSSILVISLIMRKLPFVVRSSSSLLYQISPSIEEASISLGYSPPRTFWKITLRLLGSGILSGAVLAWVTTLAELSSSIVLYTARTQTMPVMIYQAVTSTDYGRASALSVILIVSTVVPLFLVNKTILKRGTLM